MLLEINPLLLMQNISIALATVVLFTLSGCNNDFINPIKPNISGFNLTKHSPQLITTAEDRLDIYKEVTLSVDLSSYSDNQKKMLSLLIDASKIMDDLFWKQAFSHDKKTFLASIKNEKIRKFAEINYGPWDRLDGDKLFLTQFTNKALGAEFYPKDMTKSEFKQAKLSAKENLYSIISRDEEGQLISIAYSELYSDEINRAAAILEKAATFADNQEFANYLTLRAESLRTDEYQISDLAWLDMNSNPIDLVIGPIKTYEDQLYGYRAAFESYVLLKDIVWSEKLAKYAQYLPELQKGLPVNKKYKVEVPSSKADINAYDVIYYAGQSNTGSKTIAINRPNDDEVQLKKGTRRLQLKTTMRAKFDMIMLPIADTLIIPEQRKNVTFNGFFTNTMFHEIAHGLGIKNTIDNKGTVRESLKDHASALEESKADIIGLYMIHELLEKGVISEGNIEEYYTTFLADIFRTARFGASSAHGKTNMVGFNYLQEKGAFERNEQGLYSVNMENMGKAIDSLSKLILTLQGKGDYQGVAQLVKNKGFINENLASDIIRLDNAKIPVDIVFKQGKRILGL